MRKNILCGLILVGMMLSLSDYAVAQVRVRNTPIPDGVRNNSSVGTLNGGVEVREYYQSNYGTEIIITPFRGKRSPAYNQGRREAKREARYNRQANQIAQAIEKGVYDAQKGVWDPSGISLRYLREYEESFERERAQISNWQNYQYENEEYQQGREDYYRNNPSQYDRRRQRYPR